jgi:hypothetical protein
MVVSVGGGAQTINVTVAQPGQIKVQRPVGLYSVSTKNGYYALSLLVEVNSKETTEVDVSVSQASARVVFSEVDNPDFSPIVPSWEPLTVNANDSSFNVKSGDYVFLDYSALSPGGCASSDYGLGRCTVRAAVLLSSTQIDGLWLQVLSSVALNPRGLQDLYLVRFGVSATVSTYAA